MPMRRTRSLLRARGERHRRRAAEPCDEFPPPHSITSSARASSDGGSMRPSAFAVLRLTIRLVPGRRLHRQVGGLLALEDAIDVARGASVLARPGQPHRTSDRHRARHLSIGIDGGQPVPRGSLMIISRWRIARPPLTIRPPFGSRANAATPRSISPASRSSDRAQLQPDRSARRPGSPPSCPMPSGSVASRSKPRASRRRDLLEQLQPLPAQAEFELHESVALPPGRARLSTTPAPTGSIACGKTIGTVRVTCCTASAARARDQDDVWLERDQFHRGLGCARRSPAPSAGRSAGYGRRSSSAPAAPAGTPPCVFVLPGRPRR